VDYNSLAATIDAVNEAFFYGRALSKTQRVQAAKWIASQQDKPGAYPNLFAPVENELEKGMRLFTGEKLPPDRGLHVLGEEACRALILLDVSDVDVQNALSRARLEIISKLDEKWKDTGRTPTPWRLPGIYCCGKCSVALWRHLVVRDRQETEGWLEKAMKALKAYRGGDGRWPGFPLDYTLLVLSEMDRPSARAERRYAASVCEQYLSKRTPRNNTYSQRRRLLAQRILEQC